MMFSQHLMTNILNQKTIVVILEEFFGKKFKTGCLHVEKQSLLIQTCTLFEGAQTFQKYQNSCLQLWCKMCAFRENV